MVRFERRKSHHKHDHPRNKKAQKEKETLALVSLANDGNASNDDDNNKNFCEPASEKPKNSEHILLHFRRNVAFTSQVVMATDRPKITSNTLNDIITSIIQESQERIKDFALSKTNTLQEDVEKFDTVKKKFGLM